MWINPIQFCRSKESLKSRASLRLLLQAQLFCIRCIVSYRREFCFMKFVLTEDVVWKWTSPNNNSSKSVQNLHKLKFKSKITNYIEIKTMLSRIKTNWLRPKTYNSISWYCRPVMVLPNCQTPMFHIDLRAIHIRLQLQNQTIT